MYKNWFWNPICPDYFQLSVRLIASPCLISSHKILFAPFNPRFSDTFFLNLALGVFATQGKWEEDLKSDHRKFVLLIKKSVRAGALCSLLCALWSVFCALCECMQMISSAGIALSRLPIGHARFLLSAAAKSIAIDLLSIAIGCFTSCVFFNNVD